MVEELSLTMLLFLGFIGILIFIATTQTLHTYVAIWSPIEEISGGLDRVMYLTNSTKALLKSLWTIIL